MTETPIFDTVAREQGYHPMDDRLASFDLDAFLAAHQPSPHEVTDEALREWESDNQLDAALDKLGVPIEVGRTVAARVLEENGIYFTRARLARVLHDRKTRIEDPDGGGAE